MSSKYLDGKVAVITGASGGLGSGVVKVFKEAGANTFTGDMPPGELWFDAANKDNAGRIVRDVVEEAGRLDILVNLAGGYTFQPIFTENTGEEDAFEEMLHINFTTARMMLQAALPVMMKQGEGRILAIAARQGLHGLANNAAYGASKAALVNLIQAAASEVQGKGVSINAIAPTIIDTPNNRNDMPKADFSSWVNPADIGSLAAFLCTKAGGAVNGAIIPIGGPLR